MTRIFRTLFIATFAVAIAAPALAQTSGTRMAYRGELNDDVGNPISGVFPLTFKLYDDAGSDAAFWSEEAFVAVVNGVYDVTLHDIPSARVGDDVYIGVDLGEMGELVRHRTVVTEITEPQTRDEAIAALDLTYADIADRAVFAVEADTAEHCTSIGGKTLEDLDRFDEVLGEIAELRSQVDQMEGARLGSRTTTLERIGGAGGNAYSRTCPPGNVVIGARGGAGALIDSIELICAPLQ